MTEASMVDASLPFELASDGQSMAVTMATDSRLIDRAVQAGCVFLAGFAVADPAHFKLVLRELLLNALEHGNRRDPSKTIRCAVTYLGDGLFRITVQDEGAGFDYRNLNTLMPNDPRQVRRRGYPLIQSHSETMAFEDPGNRVTVQVRMLPVAGLEVAVDAGWLVLRPGADITASAVESIRKRLLDELAGGRHRIRFDLRSVVDIDSVGLSLFVVLANMADQYADAELEIVNIQQGLRDLFHLLRLDQRYRLRDA